MSQSNANKNLLTTITFFSFFLIHNYAYSDNITFCEALKNGVASVEWVWEGTTDSARIDKVHCSSDSITAEYRNGSPLQKVILTGRVSGVIFDGTWDKLEAGECGEFYLTLDGNLMLDIMDRKAYGWWKSTGNSVKNSFWIKSIPTVHGGGSIVPNLEKLAERCLVLNDRLACNELCDEGLPNYCDEDEFNR